MTTTAADTKFDIVDEMVSRGVISADDVVALRREVFHDGIVDRGEAVTVFRLENACAHRDDSWNQFYVDALTDYFVWRSEPRGYISEQNAEFLIENIMHDGRIDGPTELELLVNIVHWAKASPLSLIIFVLEAVRDSVMNANTAVYGKERNPGVIDPVDVEIIRKVIYAPSSEGGFTVTRREAELLFDLHRATANTNNDPGWPDLFVKAIPSHLMFPRGAPIVPNAEEAERHEEWLNERRGVRGLLAGIAKAFARGDISVSASWSDFDPTGARAEREAEMLDEYRARDAVSRESIDEMEAHWLVRQIGDQDPIHPDIRAILVFILEHAPTVHNSIHGLFDRAGIEVPATAEAVGHGS